ncbi:oxidoreductase [Sphaerimonospora thailandensis]|uniref:Oxidoreductase n=2 Tax=Sphaerimonospora thailandensis TaxID=795644 RepID=A0A8J3R8Y5_9ACTN|nr:PQQ-dependent sugar dehydrogenase [Sphaerimonospora thailandensis]GIH70643.1 oxidoreductase [Sphaerimonospora thailandensis]
MVARGRAETGAEHAVRRATAPRTAITMVVIAVLSTALAACSGTDGGSAPPASRVATAQPSADGSDPASVDGPRTLVRGLSVPWAIAFLPGGDALVTERDSARLFRVTPQGRRRQIDVIEGVSPSGEGGLLGVAVSPAYSTDRYIFLYFTADDDNRIVRYRYGDRGLSDPVAIVTGIPKGGIHNGGRLAFGPDGCLYASTGETGDEGQAQDRDSLAGKILRMTLDGRPAPGNPFGSLVWTYGHRNVQGLAWDGDGRMYATEFGQNTYDEINLIEKGRDYGWPDVEGVGGKPGFTDPLLTWSTDEASPSGLAYAEGSLWAAALRGRRLWRVPLDGSGRPGRPVALYSGEYGRLRAVATAPDGTLWVSTSNRDGRGDPRDGDDRILVIPPSRSTG